MESSVLSDLQQKACPGGRAPRDNDAWASVLQPGQGQLGQHLRPSLHLSPWTQRPGSPSPRQRYPLLLHHSTHTHLNGFVEDAGTNLDHLQVLLLLITCAFDVGHPASVVLLAGVDEVAHRAILVEHLGAGESGGR